MRVSSQWQAAANRSAHGQKKTDLRSNHDQFLQLHPQKRVRSLLQGTQHAGGDAQEFAFVRLDLLTDTHQTVLTNLIKIIQI